MARVSYPPVPRVNRTKAVERLFWRAGFGPSAADRRRYHKTGLGPAIESLLNPRSHGYTGRQMRYYDWDGSSHAIDITSKDDWAIEVLWWLDRMVRAKAPLVERMTLNLHDHFATSMEKVNDRQLMITQNELLRRYSLGNFRTLCHLMWQDRAMQWWLDLVWSGKDAPNENFARELMELFTIGLHYTQHDVTEAARAFTGVTYDWDTKTFGWDPDRHDDGPKTIFGKTGNWGPDDVIDLCIAHPQHAPFLCAKLWGYFVPAPPSARRLAQLTAAYVRSGYELKPVLRTIMRSPEFYAHLDQPDMIKPPVVYLAGMLRATKAPHLRASYRWVLDDMGQQPFFPPNVAGWHQGEEFLTTGSLRARFSCVAEMLSDHVPKDGSVPVTETPAHALATALARTGDPWISRRTHSKLTALAKSIRPGWDGDKHFAVERRQVLQQLLLSGPDAHLH